MPMLQNEDSLQGSAPRQSESRLPVPRRPVHEDSVRILAYLVFTNPIFTNNDAVVAQDFYTVERAPQTCRRTLACSGMADEQVAPAVGPHDANSVQLDRLLLREPVHDQQLIQRIFQGGRHTHHAHKGVFVHLQSCLGKSSVYQQPFVGQSPERWSKEVEP